MSEVDMRDLIGKPFEWKGRGPDKYDCYGLVREMYRRHGKIVPDYNSPTTGSAVVAAMMAGAIYWKKVECKPGVIIAMHLLDTMHVGFVLPFNKMIHVWERSGGVCIESITQWQRKAIGFYDYE